MKAAAIKQAAFDPRRVKRDFPIFANNPGLVFLDSAASAQKPAAVIDRRRAISTAPITPMCIAASIG